MLARKALCHRDKKNIWNSFVLFVAINIRYSFAHSPTLWSGQAWQKRIQAKAKCELFNPSDKSDGNEC